MISLRDFIYERRGVVTGENSWSKTAECIAKQSGNITIDDPKCLAPWMCAVRVIQSNTSGTLASYDDTHSKIVDGKLDITITISSTPEQSIIEHELSHAFDDWIARTKRGKKNQITDKYCIGTGYEMDEQATPLDIIEHPEECTCDELFVMFKYCTYFFDYSEVNAYSREFVLYLEKHPDVDLKNLMCDPKLSNESGTGPLVWIDLLYNVIDNADKFCEDSDHVDWGYIEKGLHDTWSLKYLGKNINGSTPKESVINTITYILNHPCKNTIKKFSRILKDYGPRAKNIPVWLKN